VSEGRLFNRGQLVLNLVVLLAPRTVTGGYALVSFLRYPSVADISKAILRNICLSHRGAGAAASDPARGVCIPSRVKTTGSTDMPTVPADPIRKMIISGGHLLLFPRARMLIFPKRINMSLFSEGKAILSCWKFFKRRGNLITLSFILRTIAVLEFRLDFRQMLLGGAPGQRDLARPGLGNTKHALARFA